MKNSIVLLLLLVCSMSFAQSVNDYKYVLVPAKFSFQNSNDEYRLNTVTKMLLEKYGFTVFLSTEVMPEEMINGNCNKIYVDVVSSGSFITTRLKIILKDCKNNILYSSMEGTSKEKEYRLAYNESLRAAAKSFETIHYKYKVKAEPVVEASNIALPNKEEPIQNTTSVSSEVLFAQPIAGGFQLIDKTPKVIMKIFNTTNKNIYTATKGVNEGVLISKNNSWYFEYYQKEQLISEKVEVKF